MTGSKSFTDNPEVQETLAVVKKEDVENTKIVLNRYFSDGIQVMDFSEIPLPVRLSFIQKTPKAFIKKRKVGGKEIPYVDHYFAEKCLNFVSNFEWGSELIRSDIKEEFVETRNGKKKAFDAMVEMNFWINLGEKKIKRFIVAGHRMFENPATTRADALKSAVSKANTVFARQLGVGTNMIDEEGRAYNAIIETMDSISPVKNSDEKFNAEDFQAPVKKSDQDKKIDEICLASKKQAEELAVRKNIKDFCFKIAGCRSLEELNKLKDSFQAVCDSSDKGDLSDEEIKEIWIKLGAKVQEFSLGRKKELSDEDFNEMFPKMK